MGTPPPPQRLESLASGWRQQQLAIPWLLQAIESSPEAIRSRQQGLRLADPLEVVARSLRLLGSRHPDALAISLRVLRAMGQAPFEPPSVKGWPHNAQWLNLRWLQARRRSLQALLADEEVWASGQPHADSAPGPRPAGRAHPFQSLSPVCCCRRHRHRPIPCWCCWSCRRPDCPTTISPIGYQTNLMVFGPGSYRFLDVLLYGCTLSLLHVLTVPALVLGLG